VILPLLVGCAAAGWFDRQPPSLTLECPRAADGAAGLAGEAPPLSGPLTAAARARDEGSGVVSLQLVLDDAPLEAHEGDGEALAAGWTLAPEALSDGPHALRAEAVDGSRRANRAVAGCVFETDNSPPVIEIAEASTHALQGRTLGVFIRLNEPAAEVRAALFGQPLTLYRLESDDFVLRALVGIEHNLQPQGWPLTVIAADMSGNVAERQIAVQVEAADFPYAGHVWLPPTAAEQMIDRSGYLEARARRFEAYAVAIDEPLWSGPFLQPARGYISSEYGVYRTYSTGDESYHTAIDIANEPGTPIYAAARGRVTLSEMMHTFGNAVVIGHGQGVSTSYSHMTERRVALGEIVERGQLIGTMGTTGVSTGPHLHWGMIVRDISVDPSQWEQWAFEYDPQMPFR
jgi:hypothetical protein